MSKSIGILRRQAIMSHRVAVIAPTSLLDWVRSQFQLTFHLVLTKRCLEDAIYMDFYRRCRLEGDFLILDNSAAEDKTAVEGSSMMDIAEELRPDIVVAPDVIYTKTETLARTGSFLAKYKSDLDVSGIKVMAVPQGTTSEEWYNCYEAFNADSRIDWLGISMFYTPKFSKRLEALRLIAPTIQKPCHLLGLWDNPYSLLEERKFDFVHSIDTAKMIEYALEGLTPAEWIKHRHLDDDWFFGLCSKETAHRRDLMTENITAFIKLFREGKI